MISKTTQVSLQRMRELQAVMKVEGDDTEETTYDEYRTLLGEVMDECEAVVRMLAKAGMFTISIDLNGDIVKDITSEGYDSITMDVDDCFDNGNVWLKAGNEITGGTLIQGWNKDKGDQ